MYHLSFDEGLLLRTSAESAVPKTVKSGDETVEPPKPGGRKSSPPDGSVAGVSLRVLRG